MALSAQNKNRRFIGVLIRADLQQRLAATAKRGKTSMSEEVRKLLEDGLPSTS